MILHTSMKSEVNNMINKSLMHKRSLCQFSKALASHQNMKSIRYIHVLTLSVMFYTHLSLVSLGYISLIKSRCFIRVSMFPCLKHGSRRIEKEIPGRVISTNVLRLRWANVWERKQVIESIDNKIRTRPWTVWKCLSIFQAQGYM